MAEPLSDAAIAGALAFYEHTTTPVYPHPREMAVALRELLALRAWRTDPAAVRIAVLRGDIAVPPDLVWLHDTNGPVAALCAVAEAARTWDSRWYAGDLSRFSTDLKAALAALDKLLAGREGEE